MSTRDELDRREAEYDLDRVRSARPRGRGECNGCLTDVRARFPVLIGCMNRISVRLLCARCAMMTGDPQESSWCIWRPTRAEAERYLLAALQPRGAEDAE